MDPRRIETLLAEPEIHELHCIYRRGIDRLEERDGAWKVQERALVRDVIRFDPVGAQWGASWRDLSLGDMGARSDEDLSYRYPGDALREDA